MQLLRIFAPTILFGVFEAYLFEVGFPGIILLLLGFALAAIGGYLMVKGENYRSSGDNDASLSSLLRRYHGGLYSFFFEGDDIRGIRRQHMAFELSKYARKSKSPADLARITKFAEKQIRHMLPTWPRRYFLKPYRHDQQLWPLQDLLKAAKAPNELELSKEIVLATLRKGWESARGRAIHRIGELGGVEHLPFLIDFMDNPALKLKDKGSVLGALQSIGPVAGHPEVIDRVFKFMAEVDQHQVYQKSYVIQTLIALKAGNDPRIAPYISSGKMTPWVRFALRLQAEKIDGSALLDRMIAADLFSHNLSNATKIRIGRLLQAAIDKADLYETMLSIMGKRKEFFIFDQKWYDEGGYLRWVDELAAYSAPRMSICDATFNGSRTWQDLPLDGAPDREGEIQCTCAGQAVVVKGLETDFLDPSPLLAAINNTLEAITHPLRYYYTDGDDVLVFLGPASGMSHLISTLDFPFALFHPYSFNVERDPFFQFAVV